MDDDLSLREALIAVATLLAGILAVLVLTAGVGWVFSAITPLTLAQGIFVSIGTLVVALISLSRYGTIPLFGLLVFAVGISLATSASILLLAWPMDLLTSLTRWEATLQAFAVVNILAYVFLRQAIEESDPVVRLASTRTVRHVDRIDHNILEPPSAVKPSRRRRSRKRDITGGDEGVS